MNEYLYTLRGVRTEMVDEGPTPEEAEILAAHSQYVRELGDDGVAIHAGRTQEDGANSVGLVALCAESTEAAESIMNRDPAVAGGVLRAKLHPYRTAVHVVSNPQAKDPE